MRILALLLLGSGLAACSGGDAPEPLTAEERLAMPADPVTGRQLFRACAVCHAFREGEPHRVGPNLHRVVGAPSARHPDFAYSRALERADLVWDEATPFRPKLRVRVNKRRLDGSGTSEVFEERECVLMRGFAFESAAWWKADFVVVQLSTVWRQSEAETVARLGTLRKGTATPADVAWFNDRCTRPPLQLPVGSARPLLLAPRAPLEGLSRG